MKPIHFLCVDHHSHSEYTSHCHTDKKSTSLHQDCDICLFMLQAFIPHKFVELQQYFEIYFAEIITADFQSLVYQLFPQISLRAPPISGSF